MRNTSEIDVIMIHRSGIYVFESKNYSGWIFGSETSQTWTQTFKRGRGSVKEHFYNPIKQNSTHIKYLKKQLKEEMPIRSIIIFSERCELKSIEILSSDVSVIRRFDLHAVVERMMHENGESLDEVKIKDIYERLYPFTQVSDDVKERHINSIEKRYKTTVGLDNPSKVIEGETNNADDKDSEVLIDESVKDQITHENMICPRCGAKLVLRTSKKGERAGKNFYGCSTFPKCRYIQDI